MASRSHPKLISYRTGGIAQHWHTAMFPPSTTSHANYSSICSPSPHRAFLSSLLSSLPLSSPLSSSPPRLLLSPIPPSGFAAVCGRRGPRLPYSAFNLSLISLHCNGKWFLCFYRLIEAAARPSPPWDSGCLGVGGVFNFTRAQNVFYQRIHISNMILHINQTVCKWPNRKIAEWGRVDRAREENENRFHSRN